MSKMIKCDVCGKTIDFSKRQTLERIELNGIGLTVNIVDCTPMIGQVGLGQSG